MTDLIQEIENANNQWKTLRSKEDHTGKIFGTAKAIGCYKKGRHWAWILKCDCGAERHILRQNLKQFKHCGNKLHRKHKMNLKKMPEYTCYMLMKGRCYNKTNPSYNYYGGRGVKICKEWLDSFDNFYTDMGKRPSEKHSIDRIDVNGNYNKENCRWATVEIQAINKRKRKNQNIISRNGKFSVSFRMNKKLHYIGTFLSLKEAKTNLKKHKDLATAQLLKLLGENHE